MAVSNGVSRLKGTKNGEASLVKHATPGPERTKEGSSCKKVGRLAVRGEGPCDRNCHLRKNSPGCVQNIATAKHHQRRIQWG